MTDLYERCRNCQREYLFPHLCRDHMLCGRCHPPVVFADVLPEDGDE